MQRSISGHEKERESNSRMETRQVRKAYKMSIRRHDGKRQFANLGRKWEDITTYREEIGCEGVN
jgi:hypothetical protein